MYAVFCLILGATGRSTEETVALMQQYVRLLELREKSKDREMYGNIVAQVLAVGGHALISYMEYTYGGSGKFGANTFIPIPLQQGSTSSHGRSPSWSLHAMERPLGRSTPEPEFPLNFLEYYRLIQEWSK